MQGPVRFSPLSYLEDNARRLENRVAIIDEGRAIGFVDLLHRVHNLTAALDERGVLQAGKVVAVSLPNVWEYVALELAIPAGGGVIMPLPLSLGEREIAHALSRTQATAVIAPSGSLPAVVGSQAEHHPAVIDVEELFAVERPIPTPRPARPDPEQVVEIALTSGTTGMPKLAGLDAELKQATFEGFTHRLELTDQDRILIMSPLSQGIGGMCLYGLRAGAALVMLHDAHFSAERTLELVVETRATYLVGVPTNVIRLLNSPSLPTRDLSSLRATAVAGAPMPPEVARAWEERSGAKICIFYGSMDAGQLAVGSPSDPIDKRWQTVGRPHEVAECQICDPDGRALPIGAVGEICMRGPTVQKRYWGEDHGPLSADGWAHMGDLGFLDPDGYLHVVGRVKDIIIRGGSNINPYEVESVLRQHPHVEDVAVVGRPDSELGERAVAFVVLRPGRTLTQEAMMAFLHQQGLAKYKWPESLVALPELPLSGPGKVNRRHLRELAAEPAKSDTLTPC